jgi:DNA-binding GntR family transcriptional regulator
LTPKSETELRTIVDRMVRAAERSDMECVFDLDRDLHALLWELAEHSILLGVVTHLCGRLDALLRDATIRRPPDEMRIHAQAHLDLVDAIVSGDQERGRRQIASHVQDATDRLCALQEQAVSER